jgi:hypothetical protein
VTRPITSGLLHRPGNPGTKGKLLAKSLEAYLLALETINRLTITYRIETFCALACNAWELLLKAKILEDSGSKRAIYRPVRPGERPKSLSLSECLPKVFLNEHDPIRRNIARVEGLRDEAIHLFISEVPKDVLGLLQACVVNYYDCLSEWFDVALSERVSIGMMTIVLDTSPERLDLGNPVMRRRLGKEAADYLTSLTQQLRDEQDVHGHASRFSVEINYSLAIQKKPEGAALLAVTDATGTATRLVQVPKDPSEEYPFRLGDIVGELNARLSPERPLTTGDLQAVLIAEHVKQNREWFYQGKVPGSPPCYSRRFADWFVTRFKQDPSWLTRCRATWHEHLRSKSRPVAATRPLWPHA